MKTLQDIVLKASDDIRKSVARSLRLQCGFVKRSGGNLTTDLERRIQRVQEQLRRAESLQNARLGLFDKTENILSQIRGFVDKTKLEGVVFLDGLAKETILKNEKQKDIRELMQGTENFYRLLEIQIRFLEGRFERAKRTERGFGRYGRMTLGAYVATLKTKLKKLEDKLAELQNVRSINIEKTEFAKLFENPDETREIANLFTRVINYCQKTNDIHPKKMGRFVQTLVDTLIPEDHQYRPFEHVGEGEKCRIVQTDGTTLYDLEKLPSSAVRKGFYALFSRHLQNHANAVLKDL